MTPLAGGRGTSRPATARCRSCGASTFTVDAGEIVVILGANGAGKTTTLRAISGMIETKGRIERRRRRRSAARSPRTSCALGVAHVPQGRGTFVDLTVEENLRLGAYTRKDGEIDADIDRWYEVFPRLPRAPRPAGRAA